MKRLQGATHRWLRWSERYTRTDMIYLTKGSFWMTAGQGVSAISALLLSLAFANLAPPETYGTYKYLLSVAAIFALFALPGMHTAVARAVARGSTASIPGAIRARMLWSFLGMFAAFLGGAYYFVNGNIELTFALLLIGITLPFFDTYTLYNAYLTGKRNFKAQTITHGAVQLVSTLSLVCTIFFTSNLLLILAAYFIPLCIVRFVAYRIVIGEIREDAPDPATLRYGKQLSIIGILSTIAGNIDKILLWKFLGPAQLAIYAFALAIPEQFKGPLKGVGELAFPKFAAQTPSEMSDALPTLWRKLAVYTLILSVISATYIALAPYIFGLLFPLYMESVVYSQIYAISLISAVSAIPIAALEAQKKTVAQYFLNTIQPITSVVLMLVLIPMFGVMGAVCGLVAGRMISTAYVIGTAAYVLKHR